MNIQYSHRNPDCKRLPKERDADVELQEPAYSAAGFVEQTRQAAAHITLELMRQAFVTALLVAAVPGCFAADAIAEPKVGRVPASRQGFTLDDSGCGGEGLLADVQCLGRYLQWLDRELNVVYVKALAKLPVQDATDNRREREQLRKSQRAWLKYKREDCTLVGGLEGGSNLAVTEEAARCEEREVKARIKFLRSIAE